MFFFIGRKEGEKVKGKLFLTVECQIDIERMTLRNDYFATMIVMDSEKNHQRLQKLVDENLMREKILR